MRAIPVSLAGVALWSLSTAAGAHGCEALDQYLIGHYHGDCDKETELAHRRGEGQGADRYVGQWVQGRPGGRGIYLWENGSRLEGTFREGKAEGEGEFVSASGARYRGTFRAGVLRALEPADCPTTPGPVQCAGR